MRRWLHVLISALFVLSFGCEAAASTEEDDTTEDEAKEAADADAASANPGAAGAAAR